MNDSNNFISIPLSQEDVTYLDYISGNLHLLTD
jgi:hypothetical protein